MLTLKVIDKDNQVKAMSSGEAETNLAVSCAYLEGDKILVETTESPCWLWLQLDDAWENRWCTLPVIMNIPFPSVKKESVILRRYSPANGICCRLKRQRILKFTHTVTWR